MIILTIITGILAEIHVFVFFIVIILCLAFFYIFLEDKQGKICIILDSKYQQEIYEAEKEQVALENGKFSREYKIWLLDNVQEMGVNLTYKPSFSNTLHTLCLYCCFNIVPILIINILSSIYLTLTQAWLLSFLYVCAIIVFFLVMEQRSVNQIYKNLDSEIKQILFEEKTGYEPIEKEKFTFKYKAWLYLNETQNLIP
ncbi:MAG: hypothetical protein FK733_00200 [Asgard group archaeon]|nr:hypothetical protein [Asgard group archaeon]